MDKVITYIDLETLMDIRQGYISTLNKTEDEIVSYVSSDEYLYRDNDLFKGFDDSKGYTLSMEKPDIMYLVNSTITHILYTLNTKIFNSDSVNKFQGSIKEDVLWINTYPFELTPKIKDTIRESLFKKLMNKVKIEVIYLHPINLTPSYIKGNNIETMFIYNLSKWLNYHLQSLSTNPCKEVAIYSPAIYREELNEEQKKELVKAGFPDVFSYTEYALSLYLKLKFMPPIFYINTLNASIVLEEAAKYGQEKFNEVVKEQEEYTSEVNDYGDISSEI